MHDKNGELVTDGTILTGKNLLGETVKWIVSDPISWPDGYGYHLGVREEMSAKGLYICRYNQESPMYGGHVVTQKSLDKMEVIHAGK